MLKRWRTKPQRGPEWKQRLDRSRSLLEKSQVLHATLTSIGEIEARIETALEQQKRIDRALEQIDPEQVERELKTALREKHDHTADDSVLITTLRRRRETVHSLIDQRNGITDQIATTLADLETLAAKSVATRAGTVRLFDDDLRRLEDDLTALAAAHEEIADL